MAKCETCGNEYEKAFKVILHDGVEHTFDSFECAFQKLAMRCSHCGIQLLGHGLEENGKMFCCANCARSASRKTLLVDHAI